MDRDVRYIETILRYCTNIEEAVHMFGSDEEDFLNNIQFQHSCAFSLLQIGEIVKRISTEQKSKHPAIEWNDIARFRDVLTHNYGKVELPAVWSVIVNDIPPLKEECESILIELRSR